VARDISQQVGTHGARHRAGACHGRRFVRRAGPVPSRARRCRSLGPGHSSLGPGRSANPIGTLRRVRGAVPVARCARCSTRPTQCGSFAAWLAPRSGAERGPRRAIGAARSRSGPRSRNRPHFSHRGHLTFRIADSGVVLSIARGLRSARLLRSVAYWPSQRSVVEVRHLLHHRHACLIVPHRCTASIQTTLSVLVEDHRR
jgi:hypothetical protein